MAHHLPKNGVLRMMAKCKVDLRSVPKVKVNCNVCSVYTVNVINMKS